MKYSSQILRLYFLVISVLLFLGCSDDEDINPYEQYYGIYEITRFESNIAVDLNDDGVNSTNLFDEILQISSSYDLRIKEAQYTDDDIFVDMSFPKTNISFDNPFNPQGTVSFTDYGAGIGFANFNNGAFFFETDQYIENAYTDNEPDDRIVYFLTGLVINEDETFSITLNKPFYDFAMGRWIYLEIEVLYERIVR
ncbi:MAG: hypothetical protein WBG46_00685 [Nonlabens sp.]